MPDADYCLCCDTTLVVGGVCSACRTSCVPVPRALLRSLAEDAGALLVKEDWKEGYPKWEHQRSRDRARIALAATIAALPVLPMKDDAPDVPDAPARAVCPVCAGEGVVMQYRPHQGPRRHDYEPLPCPLCTPPPTAFMPI